MITAGEDRAAAVYLERSFELARSRDHIKAAHFMGTAHGIYEPRVNDRAVSAAVLDPGWTAFEWHLEVQRRDVTQLLRETAGVAGAEWVDVQVLLGNGWWRSDLGFEGLALSYGDVLGFIGGVEIVYEDGFTQRVVTAPDWTARASEVTMNNLYQGERIDARLKGRQLPLEVREVPFDRGTLVATCGPDVKRQEVLDPVRIWRSPKGATLVDFGQNITGWARLRVQGEQGSVVTVRHAEVLERDELGTRPLRNAAATDSYVLSGTDDEFEPTLTFHGFRYAQVDGYPGELSSDDLKAVVVHSELRRTGTFECSDELVNRLVANSVWSQRDNFLHIPTDCPQRDERLGWTGDIAVYAATACFQFDCRDFLNRWLRDLEAEARCSGHVPFVVPDLLKLAGGERAGQAVPTAIWGDAAVWVPQALWEAFGEVERLRAHYPAMVLHLESVLPRLSASGLWDNGFQFGDWLDPTAPPDNPGAAKADRGVVATACLYRSALFTARAAGFLGYEEDAKRWEALATRTRTAFRSHYVQADRVLSDCETVYALAIMFGLLDDDELSSAGQRLAELVNEDGHRVSTGFAGTPFVTWALSETGHVDDAYKLMLQTECPSWLYTVSMGATTIWERWDSMLPDGSINPGEMTSFNHYALGAVADWLYKVVAGLRPGLPGYERLLLKPTPGPGLGWARATLETRHGRAECGWSRDGGRIETRVVVPPGVEADLVLPNGTSQVVGEGEHVVSVLLTSGSTTGGG
jgi:alpha-L-rhamnosidase